MATKNLNVVEDSEEILDIVTVDNKSSSIFTASSEIVTVNAAKRTKSVSITGNENDNSIRGGSGSDTLNGKSGDNTLTGGAGKDVFVYSGSGGDDLITDFSVTQDKIKIENDTIIASAMDEEEKTVTLYFESGGSLTIQGAVKSGKPQKITVIDSEGVTTSQAYGAATISVADSDGSIIATDINSSVEIVNAANRKKAVYIGGNENDNLLVGGKGNDTLYDGGSYANDTLTGGKGADTFIYSGGDDVITDYDQSQGDVIIFADVDVDTYSFSEEGLVFETSGGNLTIIDGKNVPITWISSVGNMITKPYNSPDEIIFSKDDDVTSFNANTLSYLRKNNIDASRLTKGIKITGNARDNIIKGSSGADSLYGYTGDDTLYGGKGKDTIVHNVGNDVVMDYTAGQDVIQIYSPNVQLSGASVSADEETDIVLTFSNKSTVTIKNAITINSKGKKTYQKITIADSKGNSTSKTYAVDSIKLSSKDSSTFNADSSFYSDLVTINAANTGKSMYIKGNDKSNIITGSAKDDTLWAGSKSSTLVGGAGSDYLRGSAQADSLVGGKGNDSLYGYGGKDTLIGGAGSDTLTGGNGADVFVYTSGDGNDVIVDYSTEDIIKLGSSSTKVKKAARSGNDYVLTIGSGKLTLKNVFTKEIKVVDYKGKETIYNGSTSSSTSKSKAYVERSYLNVEDDDLWFNESGVGEVSTSSSSVLGSLSDCDLSSILKNDVDSLAYLAKESTSTLSSELNLVNVVSSSQKKNDDLI